MTPAASDTIAAIATPPGRGGIGVVRISGPAARAIAQAVLGQVPAPRRAQHRPFRGADGRAIDSGLALFFPAPHSFTGEDVLELQGHGGPVVLDMVLERALELGARLARPGEFSERAFLNGRLDLAQAEAVADLIDSGSRQAARSALRSLEGEFSARIAALVERLTALRVHVEAAIDFSDEDIDFLAEGSLRERLASVAADLAGLTEAARQGCAMREGLRVVIAGRPNVGKSSLLNRLARREAAIVSDIPGTTRDVLREYLAIDGLPLHVVDTAGLRESRDPVERIGVERARAELGQADRVLWVIDEAGGDAADSEARGEYRDRLTVVHNKIDLAGAQPGTFSDGHGIEHIRLSALTGAGLDLLAAHLKACAGYQGTEEGAFIARRRHLDALRRAADDVDAAARLIDEGRAGELAAEELRLAQRALGEITGEVTSEELLGRIFASFCIGK
jgi:tRNA modification GTPase